MREEYISVSDFRLIVELAALVSNMHGGRELRLLCRENWEQCRAVDLLRQLSPWGQSTSKSNEFIGNFSCSSKILRYQAVFVLYFTFYPFLL